MGRDSIEYRFIKTETFAKWICLKEEGGRLVEGVIEHVRKDH